LAAILIPAVVLAYVFFGLYILLALPAFDDPQRRTGV
jgi:hypothetical protein